MKYSFDAEVPFPVCDQDGYELVDIRFGDMENIRQWRNAQQEVLRQMAPISVEQQQHYFDTVVKQSFLQEHPKILLCSYLLNQECIGYGGLVSIDWVSRRAEVSILMATERAQNEAIYRQDLAHYLALMSEVAFKRLHFHRLFAESYSFRSSTIDQFEQFGFQREGTLREHVFKNGRWYDSIMLGLLANEWQASHCSLAL